MRLAETLHPLTSRAATPSKEFIDKELAIARAALGASDTARLPVGIGFLGWCLDAAPHAEDCVRHAASRVQVLWLSFGRDLRRWYDVARAADAGVKVRPRPHGAGA